MGRSFRHLVWGIFCAGILLAALGEQAAGQRLRFPSLAAAPPPQSILVADASAAEAEDQDDSAASSSITVNSPAPTVRTVVPCPTCQPVVTIEPYQQEGWYQPYPQYQSYFGGFYGGVEAAFLEANIPTLQSSLFTVIGLNLPSFKGEFEYSPRAYVGYKFQEGFGLRTEWWYYEAGAISDSPLAFAPPIPIGGFSGFVGDLHLERDIELNAFDFEATQDVELDQWEFMFGAGLRYARVKYTTIAVLDGTAFTPGPVPVRANIFSRVEYEGIGPTLSLETRRPLFGVDGLSFVADGRFSLLFGDNDGIVNATFSPALPVPNTFTFSNEDLVVPVWDLRFGAEWSWLFSRGARIHLGAYLEGQVWEWRTPALLSGTSGDFGFVGPTIRLGVDR